MEPKTIQLKYPVKVVAANGTETILTELTVKRAKTRDLRNLPPGAFADAQNNENAMMPIMVALYCGIPLDTAEEVDFEDLQEIMKELPSLVPGSLGTGAKSSGGSPESSTSPQT